jgi:hypothetical protein
MREGKDLYEIEVNEQSIANFPTCTVLVIPVSRAQSGGFALGQLCPKATLT